MKVQKKKIDSRAFDRIIDFIMENKALVLVILVGLALSIISPYFLTPNNLMNVVKQVTATAVVATGFTYIVASGNLDLSVGYMMGLIGVIAALLSKNESIPFFVIVIICIGVGILCGLINAVMATILGIPLFISTLAMGNVYQGVNYLLCGNKTVGGISGELTFMGQGSLGAVPVSIIILAVVVILWWGMLNKTKFGRHVLAIGGNPEASRVAGINVKKVTNKIFITSGVCVAIAGMLTTGRAGSGQPTAGAATMLMDVMAAVVIGGTPLTGGKGKVVGTLLGCLLVGIISNGLNLLGVSTNWQLVAKGLLILIAVFLDTQSTKILSRRMRRVS